TSSSRASRRWCLRRSTGRRRRRRSPRRTGPGSGRPPPGHGGWPRQPRDPGPAPVGDEEVRRPGGVYPGLRPRVREDRQRFVLREPGLRPLERPVGGEFPGVPEWHPVLREPLVGLRTDPGLIRRALPEPGFGPDPPARLRQGRVDRDAIDDVAHFLARRPQGSRDAVQDVAREARRQEARDGEDQVHDGEVPVLVEHDGVNEVRLERHHVQQEGRSLLIALLEYKERSPLQRWPSSPARSDHSVLLLRGVCIASSIAFRTSRYSAVRYHSGRDKMKCTSSWRSPNSVTSRVIIV